MRLIGLCRSITVGFAITATLGLPAHANEGISPDWSQFLSASVQAGNVTFIGENSHSFSANKKQFVSLLESALSLGKPLTVALEYVEADRNAVLQDYLVSDLAEPDTAEEKNFYEKLHHRYVSMKTPAYDDFFRAVRRISRSSSGRIKFCGIDVTKIDERKSAEELQRKRNYLQSIPKPIISMIEEVEHAPIEEVAAIRKNWDREAGLTIEIQNCASGSENPIFVLIGSGHVMRAPLNYPWRTALQLTERLMPKKNVKGLGMMLYPASSQPHQFANEKLFTSASPLSKVSIFSRASLPSDIREKMASADHSFTDLQQDYAGLYDYFLVGPAIAEPEVPRI